MQIAEQLQDLVVPIKNLKPHPDNPRKGSVEDIIESLERFGQVRPILALKKTKINKLPDNTIVAGKHTWDAAKKLKATEIAAVKVELTDEEAKAYMIADNRISDKGSYDDEALVAILRELSDDGALDGTGYSVDEVDDLIAYLGKIEETEKETFKGGFGEDEESIKEREEREETAIQQAALSAHREAVLLFSPEEHKAFGTFASELKKRWELDKAAQAALLAMKACVEEGIARPEDV